MKLINKAQVYFFDIDNTLVTHIKEQDLTETDITVTDPYDQEIVHLRPHAAHIKLLKRSKMRGCAVVVWSMGGPRWIKLICDRLGIAEYTDVGINKPSAYVDDKKDTSEWMGSHVFIKNEWGS